MGMHAASEPAATYPEGSLALQPRRCPWTRAVVILALIGFALRLILLPMPIVEQHSQIRQTQTGNAAQSYVEQGWWPPTTIAYWRGDLDARLIQELPVYNYAAAALAALTGNLDASGRLVSAVFWLLSFLVLQHILKRYLSERETFWANLLYVVAPLSVAFGQAFMPEMTIEFVSLSFVLLILKYLEEPTLLRLAWMGLVGYVGVMLKLPEVSHLYVLFFVLLLLKEKWRAFLRPRYWVLLILTAVLTKLWAGYLDEANAPYFTIWSASTNMEKFTGQMAVLFRPFRYLQPAGYVVAFILSPVGVGLAALGLVQCLRQYGWRCLPVLWLASLAVFYLLWGPRTAFRHSYYNLPSVAPLSMLVGIGTVAFLHWSRRLAAPLRWGLWSGTAAVAASPLSWVSTIWSVRNGGPTKPASGCGSTPSRGTSSWSAPTTRP